MNKTAAEIPKALFDATVRSQIATGRYASKVVRDIIGLLNAADKEILAKIAATEAPFSKARLNALLKEIRTTLREIYEEAATELSQQMLDFAEVRAGQTAALIATQLPVNYNIIQATAEQLRAIVDVAPVTVGPDKKLLLEEIFTSLAAGKEEAIRGAIRLGMVEGETIDQMIRRLRGTRANQYKDGVLEASRRHAEAMTRTIVNHTSNQAMQATFKNNADVVKGWVFVATLDGRTSITCASLSGTVWPVGKGPIPPRHPNCRSAAVPEIATWRELGFDMDEMPAGMRSSKDGLVSADISFNDWLKGQDKETQIDILGPTRQKLFASGKLPINGFTDDAGRVLTLDQLSAQNGIDISKSFAGKAKSIDLAENKIRNLDYEKCFAFDASGKQIFYKSGSKSRIEFSDKEAYRLKDSIFTHNHPGGGTFSKDDIKFASKQSLLEMRAVSSNRNYSISPPEGGWSSDWWQKEGSNYYTLARQETRVFLKEELAAGRITKDQINDMHYQHHELWLRFAEKSGAKYTWEEL